MSQFLLAVKARLEISIISLRKQEILVSKRLVPSCLLTVGRKGKESERKGKKVREREKEIENKGNKKKWKRAGGEEGGNKERKKRRKGYILESRD